MIINDEAELDNLVMNVVDNFKTKNLSDLRKILMKEISNWDIRFDYPDKYVYKNDKQDLCRYLVEKNTIFVYTINNWCDYSSKCGYYLESGLRFVSNDYILDRTNQHRVTSEHKKLLGDSYYISNRSLNNLELSLL